MITIGNNRHTPEKVIEQSQKAPGFFRLIAIFSLINTAINLFNANVNFVIGLASTMFIDVIIMGIKAEGSSLPANILTIAGISINIAITGVFFLIWWLAKKGSNASYITGMILYFCDGLLSLFFKDYIGVGFHAFFLFMLFGGYQFFRHWCEAEKQITKTKQEANHHQPRTWARAKRVEPEE